MRTQDLIPKREKGHLYKSVRQLPSVLSVRSRGSRRRRRRLWDRLVVLHEPLLGSQDLPSRLLGRRGDLQQRRRLISPTTVTTIVPAD